MSEISMDIRHCMLYGFQLGNDASAVARHICSALDVADRTCLDWFKKFGEGDTSLEDRSKSGHPLQSDVERIKILIEDNLRLTPGDLSSMLRCH